MTARRADTIVAVATPAGRGGIGVIRVSGAKSRSIAKAVLDHIPKPRYAEFLPFYDEDHQIIDSGIALYFTAPHSFTGEDVLELQGHGGPVVMDLLLQRIIGLGARLARPGEFSERAFLNNKIDLSQAEAIADLIDSVSAQAAGSAIRSLSGEFSTQVNNLIDALTQLRVYVESAIDFPEEEIDFLSDGKVADRLQQIVAKLKAVIGLTTQGRLLREGMTIVITGRPNVGKSSLLNSLARLDTAIVTDIPGTTRDVLREQIIIDGLPIHIIDTAGLRDSNDPIEQQGIQRARGEIEKADRILFVIDDSDDTNEDKQRLQQLRRYAVPVTIIRNKIDLTGKSPAINTSDQDTEILLSVKQDSGLDLLRQHLKQSVGFDTGNEGTFIARRRHLDALHRALECVNNGQAQLLGNKAGELLAEDLKQAQNILSEITGEVSSDDLLGEIFSSFCIGK